MTARYPVKGLWALLALLVATAVVLTACTAAPAPAQPAAQAQPPAQPPAQQPAAQQPAAQAQPPAQQPAAQQPAAQQPPATGQFKDPPALAQAIKDGKLPAVADRVSTQPLVVPPIEEPGQYGGTWRIAWKGPADFHAYGRLNYEAALRWPRDPKDPVQPGLAYKWEFSPDGKDLTLYFRKGLKWSDGQPWTVDDILFWWNDIEQNKDLTAAPHSEWIVNGKPMTLEKIDDYTIKLKFDQPNGIILKMLAFHGNQWPLNFERFGFFAPAHYLKQFHPTYNKDATYKLFNEKADDLNPERPVMSAWMVSQYRPGDSKLIAVRNPYYWKVDAQGNQLPYIDQIETSLVENNDAIAAKALACEIDMQYRNMDLRKYPLFVENKDKCAYRVYRWPSAQGTALALWPNQTYAGDEVLRKIFQDKNFRMALSYGIDRKKVNSVAYLDQGTPQSTMVVPGSPYYQEDVAKLYTEYDPKKANDLLDAAGLKKGPDGVRLRPDGKPLEITIETERTGADVDALQLIVADWNALGVKTALKTMSRDLFWPRATGNETQFSVWSTDRGLEPFVDPIYLFPFDERSWMAPAFGTYYKTNGAKGEKPTGKLAEAQQLYEQYKATSDPAKQTELGKQIVKMATEEAWTISTVGGIPAPLVVKNNFRNVPEKYTQDWIIFSPGNLDPSQFFYKK